MTHICVTEVEYAHLQEEFELIRSLCNFEEIIFNPINKENMFHKRYYDGGRPRVLVFNENVSEPTVLYGFWEFVKFLSDRKKLTELGAEL